MAYLRDRRAFGNIGTRKFRGARFGDPLSPRGPQYTKEGLILDYSTDVGPFTIIDQSGQDNTATLYSGRGLTMDGVSDLIDFGSPTFSEPAISVTGYARSTDTSINLGLASATLAGNDTWETFSADTPAKDYGDAQWFNGTDAEVILSTGITLTGDFDISLPFIGVDQSSGGHFFADTAVAGLSRGMFTGSDIRIITSTDPALVATVTFDRGAHTVRFRRSSGTAYIDLDGVNLTSAASTGSLIITGIGSVRGAGSATPTFNGAMLGVDFGTASYTGRGNDPWKDTIGSNDGTLSGVDQTVTEYFTNPDFILGTGYNGDLSDIRCLGATGTVLGHWTLADWSNPAGNTSNGKTIVDSGPNGYHGVCTGCSGFTGEATIPQTADRNWNKYQWFNGTEYVTANDFGLPSGTSKRTLIASFSSSTPGSYSLLTYGTDSTGARISMELRSSPSLGTTINGANRFMVCPELFDGQLHELRIEIPNAASLSDLDFYCDDVLLTVTDTEANPANTINTALNSLVIGRALTGVNSTVGIISGVQVLDSSGTSVANYTGLGNDPWVDTVGSNNGTESGAFTRELVSASDANDQIDALGTAILEPRRNTQQLNLFGEGEHSRTPDSDSLGLTTEATWEMWGNFYGATATTETFFSKYDDSTNNREWIISKPSSLADDEIRLLVDADGISGGTETSIISGLTNGTGHLVVTKTGSVIKAYWNSVEIAAPDVVGSSIYAGSSDVLIGAVIPSAPAGFSNRKIGSAKIYNRALTADEVLTNYDTQKSLYLNVFPFTLT